MSWGRPAHQRAAVAVKASRQFGRRRDAQAAATRPAVRFSAAALMAGSKIRTSE
jgi:hypothetical protein